MARLTEDLGRIIREDSSYGISSNVEAMKLKIQSIVSMKSSAASSLGIDLDLDGSMRKDDAEDILRELGRFDAVLHIMEG